MSHEMEITIGRKAGNYWPIHVRVNQPDGLTSHLPEMKLPLEKIQKITDELEDKKYGTLLGQALFQADFLKEDSDATTLRERLKEELGKIDASSHENSLRILLSIDNAEDEALKTLHWQRLCAPIDSGFWSFLAQDKRIPFSMYIPTAISKSFPPLRQSQLRALVLVASPDDLPAGCESFKVEKIISDLREVFGEDIPHTFLANIEGYTAPTLANLSKELATAAAEENPYTLLHIVSHGTLGTDKDTTLFWADEKNELEIVSGTKLVDTLRTRSTPYFTFLCACNSAVPNAEIAKPGETALGGLAQRLVRDLGMPAVIGMTRQVSIATAFPLARQFYSYLKTLGEVDRALKAATAGLEDRHDIITVPVLFSRLGGRSLFIPNDRLKPLNAEQIQRGLEQLEKELTRRAPNAQVLNRELKNQKALANQPETRSEALWNLNNLCYQILGITFDELASGTQPPLYNVACPFPGLSSFASEEFHPFFFGRSELIQTLENKLTDKNFLAVVGASGSGKSSVVLAGLVPAFSQKFALKTSSMTPGNDPIGNLETTVKPFSGHSALLVVDQFEELFTLCLMKDARQKFLKQLLEFSQQQKVVITMRSDFLEDFLRLLREVEIANNPENLEPKININDLHWVGPMEARELGEVIQEQAKAGNLRFEAGVNNAILAEVEQEPGIMPLLQYALRLLYDQRRGRWLCYEEYNEIGGVKQAIATTATTFYKDLSADEKKHVRHIFEQLTRVDEDFASSDHETEPQDTSTSSNQKDKPKDTRRRVDLNQLITTNNNLEQTRNLVTKLANKRLVITSRDEVTQRDRVEVAHEAIIVHWDELQKWLHESRDRLKFQQQIRPTIERWDKNRDDGELLRGEQLQKAGEYLEKSPDAFSHKEKAFIQASQALPRRKPKVLTVVKTGVAMTVAVAAIRLLGILQPLELAAYDEMMRHKPDEALDDRILIVGVNEKDIQNKITGTGEGQGTVRDLPLQKLLEKLQQHRPRVIALDIARDIQSDRSTKLGDELKKANLVGICTVPYEDNRGNLVQGAGVKPPFEIPPDQVVERVGFSNFRQDSTIPVRIQPLINVATDSICPAPYSFSYAAARLYLKQDQRFTETRTPVGEAVESLQLNQLSIRELTGFAGGYQGNPFGGYQGNPFKDAVYKTLLHYRSYQGDPRKFAHEVSLQDALDNKLSKDKVENKIVVIGIDSEISGDYITTPYGAMAGPIVQAQMISQVVSAVLDKRPLIWWLPVWADVLWIGVWSVIGGLIIWFFQQPVQGVIGVATIASLIGICYAVFAYQSGWIPLIPPLLALIGTAGVVTFITFKLRQGTSRQRGVSSPKTLGLVPAIHFPQFSHKRSN